MKKIKYFLILFIMLLPTVVFAESASGTIENVNWNYNDGVLTLTTDNPMVGYHVPLALYGGGTWYDYKDDIVKIIVGDGIDVVRENAFKEYANLEEVILPNKMGGQIDDYAFYNCSKLKKINIPFGITRIGDYAFYGTQINNVELPITLDWTYEHTFNEGTTITRPAEYDDIIAAGTAGTTKSYFSSNSFDPGLPSNSTCYNKFYYSYFYDDTAYWKLMKDGTLIIWGTELIHGFSGSRNPWGCYKDEIKKIVINDDKEGTISINNNICSNNKHVKLAVYSSKPVEEIMNNRIKVLSGIYLADVRFDPIYGFRNLETIVFNRGVEEIGSQVLWSTNIHPNDIYINKYVRNIESSAVFKTSNLVKDNANNVHIEVSYEDYLNNGYHYYYEYNNTTEFFNTDGTLKDPTELASFYDNPKGHLLNDVDDTYVSINDTTAPDTVEIDGKTFYKYDTYLTNSDGIANISLPNDEIDYYAKVLDDNCCNTDVFYKINTFPKTINLNIQASNNTSDLINPNTHRNKIVLIMIILLSLGLGVFIYKRIRKEV